MLKVINVSVYNCSGTFNINREVWRGLDLGRKEMNFGKGMLNLMSFGTLNCRK